MFNMKVINVSLVRKETSSIGSINAAIVAMNTLPGIKMQMMTGMPLFTIGWVMIIMSSLSNTTRPRKYRTYSRVLRLV